MIVTNNTTDTNQGNCVSQPKEFATAGSCPTCGAPIFHDAEAMDAKGVYKQLPTPYFTCNCRFNLSSQPQFIPYPIPAPAPIPPYPWWSAPTTTIPQITWRQPENINICDDHLNKTFCGSGGITQDPNLFEDAMIWL